MWVSYSLWLQFQPKLGWEEYHCHRKRGFARARGKEAGIAELRQQDTTAQKIGKLAQQAVYYLYHYPEYLNQEGINFIANHFLQLEQETKEIQNRISAILEEYLYYPFLQNKKVLSLTSGEESQPSFVYIGTAYPKVKLSFVYDCIIQKADNHIHIVDFKTGKTQFQPDLRQAFVYLVAARHLYPNYTVTASFYHLEFAQESEIYSATEEELELITNQLQRVAQNHQRELKAYHQSPDQFNHIFPATPGKVCNHCPFTSVCETYDEFFNH
ncbi:MAG: PD-(D/E)XK nuclease family protein [Halothece sp.]